MGKNGAARDEYFGAGFDHVGYGFEIDSPIHLNAEIEFAFVTHAGECGNFVEGIGNKFLAAKTGIHAHDQDVVDKVENFRERLDRRSGIENHTGLASVRGDEVEGAVKVNTGFLMNGNPIGPSVGKFGNEQVWIFDHQVTIEGHVELFAKGANDRRADGEIGDEVAVHNVQVKDGAAAVDRLLGVGGKLRKIGGKNGRRKFDLHGMVWLLPE